MKRDQILKYRDLAKGTEELMERLGFEFPYISYDIGFVFFMLEGFVSILNYRHIAIDSLQLIDTDRIYLILYLSNEAIVMQERYENYHEKCERSDERIQSNSCLCGVWLITVKHENLSNCRIGERNATSREVSRVSRARSTYSHMKKPSVRLFLKFNY